MNTQTITADVVIAGASLSGLAAAITAKEKEPSLDVLVIEKYSSGYAGKANRGGGIILQLKPGVTPEDFVAYHAKHIGGFLNKQDLHIDYASKLASNLEKLDKWSGGKLCRDPEGNLVTRDYGGDVVGKDDDGNLIVGDAPQPWTMVAIELDFILEIKRYARKLGVRFVDRVGIVDLLTSGEKVCGAVGYHIEDGTQYLFRSKAFVLATGSQDYRVLPMWAPARGEGIAAAWRAGARMSNCEFGSFFNWVSPETFETAFINEGALYNDKGEQLPTYGKDDFLDIDANTLAAWYRQTLSGNGPVHHHVAENRLLPSLMIALSGGLFQRPFADKFWGRLLFAAQTNQSNDVVVPGLIGELSPLWVDNTFQTSLPGLYGVGDISYTGSGAPGAVPAPPSRTRGGGLPWAFYSGCEAGESSAAYALTGEHYEVDPLQVMESRHSFYLPMGNNGGFAPNDVLQSIQAIMNDLGKSIYRSEGRMLKAIAELDDIEAMLPRLKASDTHELFLCNEVRSMTLCAQLFFKTSLERKESRGWFIREDYPERDDQNWLKWSIVDNDGGQMRVDFVPVPIETYPCQPTAEVEVD